MLHRSQGHTGIDPDPRDRPDPDPAGGLRSLLATTPEAAVTVAAIDGTLPPTATAAEAVGAAGTGVGIGTDAGGKQVLEGGMGSAPLTAPTVAAMPTVIGPAAAAAAAGVLESVLGDADGTSSHPVHKDDFAMGGVSMPALTGKKEFEQAGRRMRWHTESPWAFSNRHGCFRYVLLLPFSSVVLLLGDI